MSLQAEWTHMGHSLHLVCSAGPRTASSWCQQKGAQVQPPLWDGAAGMEAPAASWAVCSLRRAGWAAGY